MLLKSIGLVAMIAFKCDYITTETNRARAVMKTPVIAKFSNGKIDEYKGKRAVKAAWCVYNIETGATLKSGHSLTTQAAATTSSKWLRDLAPQVPTKPKWVHQVAEHDAWLKGKGWATHSEMVKALTPERNAFIAAHKIEIIQL